MNPREILEDPGLCLARTRSSLGSRGSKTKTRAVLVECSFSEILEITYDMLDSSGDTKRNNGGLSRSTSTRRPGTT